MSDCTHEWFMTNVRQGYLVVEGCPELGARSCFFSMEAVPPIDEYQQGKRYWIYIGSFQAVKFDLQCRACRKVVGLADMMGLMLSACEDPNCAVGMTVKRAPPGSWVYVALCADSTHAAKKCVSDEGIQALSEYFNQNIKAQGKRIIVLPCRMCDSIDRCRGIVIADAGLTDFYSAAPQGPGRPKAEQEGRR